MPYRHISEVAFVIIGALSKPGVINLFLAFCVKCGRVCAFRDKNKLLSSSTYGAKG